MSKLKYALVVLLSFYLMACKKEKVEERDTVKCPLYIDRDTVPLSDSTKLFIPYLSNATKVVFKDANQEEYVFNIGEKLKKTTTIGILENCPENEPYYTVERHYHEENYVHLNCGALGVTFNFYQKVGNNYDLPYPQGIREVIFLMYEYPVQSGEYSNIFGMDSNPIGFKEPIKGVEQGFSPSDTLNGRVFKDVYWEKSTWFQDSLFTAYYNKPYGLIGFSGVDNSKKLYVFDRIE